MRGGFIGEFLLYMKYNIYINQYSAVASGLDIDLIDLAIFDMIKDFANCNECVKINTPEGVFFWISAQKIMDDMPLLGIKTKNGIMKHIDRLCDAQILVKHPNCQHYKMQLYQFGENYDKMLFDVSTTNKSEQVPTKVYSDRQQKLIVSTNESLHNNNINNNNINNNIEEKNNNELLSKSEDRKTLFANSEIGKLVQGKDFSKFFKRYEEHVNEGVDMEYYYDAVNSWSYKSNTKRTNKGWNATIHDFIKRDKRDGKLQTIHTQTQGDLFIQGAIEYLNM